MQHSWSNLSEQELEELNIDFALALYAAIYHSAPQILSDIHRSNDQANLIPSDITIPSDYEQNSASNIYNVEVPPTSSVHAEATSYVPDYSNLLSRWTAANSDPSLAFTPENNELSHTRSSVLVCVVILEEYDRFTLFADKPH